MTPGEVGAYFRLLCFSWKEPECGLTNNQADLKILANWATAAEGDRWERVMACFPKHPMRNKAVHNPRLYREWLRAREISQERGKAAQARWSKPTVPDKPPQKVAHRLGAGFESVGQIADKHFKPV